MKRAWGRAHAEATRSPKEKVLLDKREEGGELRGPVANTPGPVYPIQYESRCCREVRSDVMEVPSH